MSSGGQQKLLESINAASIKTNVPRVDIGDTINVVFRIVEGGKERSQTFQGVVIARSGRGINEMMTVRKIVDDVGVERMFPINSPFVAKLEAVRRSDSRRSKLYFLRERTGKSRRLRDRRRGMKHVKDGGAAAAAPAAAPAANG
jgi:large subunit ribosomal protein L19